MANAVTNPVVLGQQAALAGTSLRGGSTRSSSFVAPAIRAPAHAKRQGVTMAHQEEKKSVRSALTAGALAAIIAVSGPAIALPDTKGTPADPSTVKDDLVGGLTDPASIPGRIKERANIIGEKLSGAKDSAQANAKGTPADPETVKDDAVGGVTDPASIPGRIKERATTIKDKFQGVAFQSVEAPPLSFVTLDASGTPLDPNAVKDDVIGGVTDPASIPGRIKERASIIGSKASKAGNQASNLLPDIGSPEVGSSRSRAGKLDGIQLSDRLPQRSAPSYGRSPMVDSTPQRSAPGYGRSPMLDNKNVSYSEAPPLVYVGLDTKGTPLDPETVKDDVIGGVTDPASIPGRVKERASIIGSKASKAGDQARGLVPDVGSSQTGDNLSRSGTLDGIKLSDRVPQKSAPGYGRAPMLDNKNVSYGQAPPLVYVGLNTKGTPLDPETVKDDVVGGVTDPASIPGRVKERASIIGSKASQAGDQARNMVPDVGSPEVGSSRSRDGKLDGIQLSDRVPQRSAPSYGRSPMLDNKNVSYNEAPPLVYVGLSTKGTPLDPSTVKDDAIGGVTDPASIPGRIQERASIIGDKVSALGDQVSNVRKPEQRTPGTEGQGSATDAPLSDRVPQKDRPSYGEANPAGQYGNGGKLVGFTQAPPLVYVSELSTEPKTGSANGAADPATLQRDFENNVEANRFPGNVESRATPYNGSVGSLGKQAGKLSDLVASSAGAIQQKVSGTPLDPETVKDDVVGGVTNPGSIPSRVQERAATVTGKVKSALN